MGLLPEVLEGSDAVDCFCLRLVAASNAAEKILANLYPEGDAGEQLVPLADLAAVAQLLA